MRFNCWSYSDWSYQRRMEAYDRKTNWNLKFLLWPRRMTYSYECVWLESVYAKSVHNGDGWETDYVTVENYHDENWPKRSYL